MPSVSWSVGALALLVACALTGPALHIDDPAPAATATAPSPTADSPASLTSPAPLASLAPLEATLGSQGKQVPAGANAGRFEPDGRTFRIHAGGGGHVDANGIHLQTGDGIVDILFSGGAPVALTTLPGVSHYMSGSDPTGWRTDVTRHDRILVPAVAPGVDVEVYFVGGVLEFDFVLAPGARAADARFAVEGAVPMVQPDGSLRLAGIKLPAPVAFQGPNTLGAHFVVQGQEVRIDVPEAEPGVALRIDPMIHWSSFHGGLDSEYATAAASYGGDIFVAGHTCSTASFPLASAMQTSANGCYDGYVARLDGTTGALEWSTYLGGSTPWYYDWIGDIHVDASGVTLTGGTEDETWPVTVGAFQTRKAGTGYTVDAFVTRLTLAGSSITYSTYLGGGGQFDMGTGVRVHDGKIHVAGSTTLPVDVPPLPFPTTATAYQPAMDPGAAAGAFSWYIPPDLFYTVLDPSLPGAAQLSYSTLFGTGAEEFGYALDIGPDGTAYVAGVQYDINWVTGASEPIPTKSPGGTPYQAAPLMYAYNPFVLRFDATEAGAASLVYSTYVHGTSGWEEIPSDIVVDAAGQAYLAGSGWGSSVVSATGLSGWDTTSDSNEAWIVQLDDTGSTALAATYYGGTSADYSVAIRLDSQGDVHLMAIVTGGLTAGSDQFSTAQPYRTEPWQSLGGPDVAVVKFSPDLKTRHHHYVTGGSGSEAAPWWPSTWGHYGPLGALALVDDEPAIHFTTRSTDTALRNAYDTSPDISTWVNEAATMRLGKTLPPVPMIKVTHETVAGSMTTVGTVDDTVPSYIPKVDAWTATAGTTYTAYTLDMSASMEGDVGDRSQWTWSWDTDGDMVFDDGVDDVTTIQVTRTVKGEEKRCLRIWDADSNVATTCVTLPFTNRPPTAVIDTEPAADELPVCTPVRLDGSGSFDLDAPAEPPIQSYSWDLDTSDGIGVDATTPEVSLSTPLPGTRTVRLTVTDQEGATSSTQKTLSFTGSGVGAVDDDHYLVQPGQKLIIDVFEDGVVGNDCFLAGSTLTATLLGTVPASAGTMTWNSDGTFTFAAHRNAVAPLRLKYRLADGEGHTSEANLTIGFLASNYPPEAADAQEVLVLEDTPTNIILDVHDPDGDAMSFGSGPRPEGLAGAPPSLKYTPAPEFCHDAAAPPIPFSYTAYDTHGLSDEGTLLIRVVCVADAPSPRDDHAVAIVGTSASDNLWDVVANDADPDDDGPLRVVGVSIPQRGTAVVHNTTHVGYDAPGTRGLDMFTYVLEDATDLGSEAAVHVWVHDPAANAAPEARDVRLEVEAGRQATLAFDIIDDDPVWALDITATPAKGSLGPVGHGVGTYEAPAACGIQDRFPYQASDPSGLHDEASVVVVVTCPNSPPSAVDDVFTVTEGHQAVLDVLRNDMDADGDPLRVLSVTAPAGASHVDDAVLFLPPSGAGPFLLTYTVTDGFATSEAEIRVEVAAVDDVPVARRDEASVAEDGTVLIDVLANDEDPEGGPLALVSSAAGTIEDDKVRYTPPADFSGTVTFTYTVTDQTAESTGLVVVTVTPVNDWPQAAGETFVVAGTLGVDAPGVLANDADIDSTLEAVLVQAPVHGRLVLDRTGAFTYTPHPGHVGTDTFRYAADDGEAVSIATVTLVVNPPVERRGETPAPTPAPETASAPDEFDLDVEEGQTVALLPSGPWRQASGPFVDVRDGRFKAPAVDTAKELTFVLGGMTARVRVTPANEAPLAAPIDVSAAEGQLVSIDARASDPDGDRLTYTWRQVAGSAATLSSVSAAVPTLRAPLGESVFEVLIQDGLATTKARVTVTGHASDTPVAAFETIRTPNGWWFAARHQDGLQYSWDLGDGTTATGRDAVHSYAPGAYTVRLVVTDAHGVQQEAQQQVQVGIAEGDEAPLAETRIGESRSGLAWFWALAAAGMSAAVATCWILARRR